MKLNVVWGPVLSICVCRRNPLQAPLADGVEVPVGVLAGLQGLRCQAFARSPPTGIGAAHRKSRILAARVIVDR